MRFSSRVTLLYKIYQPRGNTKKYPLKTRLQNIPLTLQTTEVFALYSTQRFQYILKFCMRNFSREPPHHHNLPSKFITQYMKLQRRNSATITLAAKSRRFCCRHQGRFTAGYLNDMKGREEIWTHEGACTGTGDGGGAVVLVLMAVPCWWRWRAGGGGVLVTMACWWRWHW